MLYKNMLTRELELKDGKKVAPGGTVEIDDRCKAGCKEISAYIKLGILVPVEEKTETKKPKKKKSRKAEKPSEDEEITMEVD